MEQYSEEQVKTKPVHPTSNTAVGDVIRLRKPHPCGSYDWRVVRVGADIGLRCLKCEHRVNLTRAEFEKRFKAFVPVRQNDSKS